MKGDRGIPPAAPFNPVTLTGLPLFRRVYAVKTDALASDLDGVAVDDAGYAGILLCRHAYAPEQCEEG